MKQVSFVARYPPARSHPIHHRLMETPDVSRADLSTWGPRGTVTTLVWVDGDAEQTGTVLDAIESVTATPLVPGRSGTYAFVHQSTYEFGEDVLDLVSGARVVFLPPIRFEDDGAVHFDAVGETAGLSEFYSDLSDLVDADIEHVREFRGRPTPARLTDRQRSALETARDVGYCEVPRTGSVDDVARELDCASSTAGEVLRKAEAAVITDALEHR